jgi:hypothetical protein
MAETSLMPVAKQQFFDDNGEPLASGKVYLYEPGTSTEKTAYSDSNGNTALSNPVVLDSSGRASIWLDGYYKAVVKDANDVTIYTTDNISSQHYQSVTSVEFVAQSDTPSYISATQFSVPNNLTSTYQVGRRVKATVTAGTLYGTITASSAGGDPVITTVTVIWDSGSLDSGLSALYLGILTTSYPSIPIPNVLSKTANYTMTVADHGKKVLLSANAVQYNLLAANAVFNGFEVEFINAGANQLTANGTINSFANVTFLQYESAKIFSDGSNWYSMNMHNSEPVGTVKAWHKSANGTPQTLPWGWVEANGAALSDTESPLNGITLPDINSNGRFIRGSNTSGNEQANQNLAHLHDIIGSGSNVLGYTTLGANVNVQILQSSGGALGFGAGNYYAIGISAGFSGGYSKSNEIASNLSIANSGNSEARPDNISMVYIIKVK